jgi:hypothetical protein
MKMTSPRKQPTAGPRFPRGLELLLLTGLLFLLIYGWMQALGRNKTTGETAAKASLLDVARNEVSPKRWQPSPAANFNRKWGWNESSAAAFSLANALAAIQAEEDSQKREEMLAALVDQIAIADIQSTLNELQQLGPSDLIGDFSLRLVRRWAENDGHAAAAWVEQLPEGPMREDALSGVAIEWANTGLEDATTWASQLPDPAEQDSALLAVANEAIRSQPVEALDIAVELPQDAQRDELIRHAAMEWGSQDGKSAADWARQITDVPMRDQTLSAIATAWSETDPLSAATLAVQDISEGRSQSDAVIGIIQRWAQQQPEQAAAWVEQFPAGELKQTAIANLASLGVTVR